FQGRCAFLVREPDAAFRAWLGNEGHAVLTLGKAGPGSRAAGCSLARLAPGAALEADELAAALMLAQCRAVVLAEGNAPEDETLARVGARLGLPTICVQQGWSPLVHTGFRNMSFAAMAMWGEGFGEILAPANPGQHFLAVG